ncbi:hypothetical protein ACLOJK_029690 [Asimina triloba]
MVKKKRKKDKKKDRIYKDTNIRPEYIGHQHLDDGLMLDVQVRIPSGSGDYRNEGRYTPVFCRIRDLH